MAEHLILELNKHMTKQITKACAYCSNSFVVSPKSSAQLYCNKSCYLHAVNQKRTRSRCLLCNKEIVSSGPRRFCNSSHAAQFNNSQRSDESRAKQKKSLIETLNKKPRVQQQPKVAKPKISKITPKSVQLEKREKQSVSRKAKAQIIGPYTRVYALICAHSNKLFYSRHHRKYSPQYQHLYSREGKALFKFTFNIYNYPDLFDLNLIEQYGWYSVGGKSRKAINKDGCSRDHKVSITEAIANQYDPYYIKHPMNCQLMRHRDNKIKHSKSSITYTELIKLVDEYDSKNGGTGGIRTLGTPLRRTAV